MNDVTKRFFEAIEELGETPYRIAKNVPVASSAKLSNAKNGANEIGLDVVAGVCEYYRNINGNYILTGRGNPIYQSEEEQQTDNIASPNVSKLLELLVRFLENQQQQSQIMREMTEMCKQIKGE